MNLSGPISAINNFFQCNPIIFDVLLTGSLVLGFVMFGFCLVHVLCGTKYPFVVGVTIAVLLDFGFYSAFCLTLLTNQDHYRIWYFFAVSIFIATHWVIAYTYFACASELPCVMARTIPSNLRRASNRVFFVIVLLTGIISSSWTFEEKPTTYKMVMLGLNMAIMVLISTIMVIALY